MAVGTGGNGMFDKPVGLLGIKAPLCPSPVFSV